MAKRKKINILRLVFIVVFVFFLTQIVKQEIKIYRLKQEMQATQVKIEELKSKQEKLLQEERNSGSPEFIEKVAREEYNMVREGEIPVLVKE